MRALPALALSLTVLTVAVAGCGGSESSAAEGWASDVCSAIGTWKTNVQKITTDATNALTEPGATRQDAETAIDDGVKTTQDLIDELKAIGPPETSNRTEAKTEVDAFVTQAESTVDDVKSALEALPANATLADIVQGLSGLATSLQATIASGQQLVTSLEELGGDLKQGFEKADSCKDLRS